MREILKMSRPINHICSKCDTVYMSQAQVVQCFFSHQEDGFIDPIPEDYIEMLTRVSLEKIPVPDLVETAVENLLILARGLEYSQKAKGGIASSQTLSEGLAAAIVSLRQLSFLLCDYEEMNILIEQNLIELHNKFGL